MIRTTGIFLIFILFSSALFSQFRQIGNQLDGNAPNDNFGFSVAIDAVGQTIAVGAPLYDDDFGQVRVYRESGGVWSQLGGDIEGTEIGNQFGFSVALNADASRLAIGGLAGSSSRAGQVRIYEWTNGQWQILGSPILGEDNSDQSGFSIGLSDTGDRVVIGAPENSGGGASSGHMRVYELQNNAWVQLGNDIDGDATGDELGFSVSISGDGNTIAAGAPENEDAFNSAGEVKVFRWQNNSWTQLGADLGGLNADEAVGSSVDLSQDGNTLVLNAPLHDHGQGFGSVRVYSFDNNVWMQKGSDMRGNSSTEAFGQAVSINANGDRVAIGTPSNDDNALSSGKVNFFTFDGTAWQELTDAAKGDMRFDNLGKSLAMNADGNRVVAGANLAGGTQGYIRVYEDSSMRVSVEGYFQDKEIKVYANGQRILLESSERLEHTEIEILNLQGQRVFW